MRNIRISGGLHLNCLIFKENTDWTLITGEGGGGRVINFFGGFVQRRFPKVVSREGIFLEK